MRYIWYKFIYLLLVISVIFFLSCKEEPTEPPLLLPPPDYFPAIDGSYYKYDVQFSDSLNNLFVGARISQIRSDTIIAQTSYQVQDDSLYFGSIGLRSFSYLRKSVNGIFYYSDTTGISLLVADTLAQYLNVDPEIRLLYQPLSVSQQWSVLKINLNYQNILSLNILDVSAFVSQKDTINITIGSGSFTREALQINFLMKLRLPDQTVADVYEASGWVVDEIGFVKWEGDIAVISLLSGGLRNLILIEGKLKQDIKDYLIFD